MAAKISNWLGTRSQRSHLSAALTGGVLPGLADMRTGGVLAGLADMRTAGVLSGLANMRTGGVLAGLADIRTEGVLAGLADLLTALLQLAAATVFKLLVISLAKLVLVSSIQYFHGHSSYVVEASHHKRSLLVCCSVSVVVIQ